MAAPDTDTETFDLPVFHDRLWGELEQLHAELTAPPGRGPSRRPYLLAVAGLAAAACVAVGAVVVTRDAPAGDDTRIASSTTSGIATEALPPELDTLVVIEWPNQTTWLDKATGARRTQAPSPEGDYEQSTLYADGPDGTHPLTQTYVNHTLRQYWTETVPDDEGYGPDPFDGVGTLADYTPDGTQVVDGRELQRYVDRTEDTMLCGIPGDPRGFTPEQCGQPGVEVSVIPGQNRVLWVDPATGRRVRATDSSYDIDGDGYVDTIVFTYLPRTPENLALLELPVPEGYSQVDPPEVPEGMSLVEAFELDGNRG